MVEQDFYAIERGGKRFSFEPLMGAVEADAAKIIVEILERGNLQSIDAQKHTILCTFAALQFLRGPATRNLMLDLVSGILKKAEEIFGPEAIKEGLTTDEERKIEALNMIYEELGDTATRFADKDLFLMQAPGDHQFILGDTPVTMMNHEDYGPYGNIGLSVTGIQIYFPLSPRFLLCFWCQSILAKFQAAVDRQAAISKRMKAQAIICRPEIAKTILDSLTHADASVTRLTKFLGSFHANTAVTATEDNVIKYNSLQIQYAQRWVISKNGDFTLARRMIADDEKYRTRVKPKF